MIDQWQLVVNRIKGEIEHQLRNNNSRKEQGVVFINLRILADCNRPIIWTVEAQRMEPSSKAKELLDLL